MQKLIQHLKDGAALDAAGISEVTKGLLDETVDTQSKVDLLKALHEKGETPEEIAGFVEAFLEHAVIPELDRTAMPGPLIDVCGTGGDKLNLFNVSTTSMFVLAAGGATVVKHGNRGITSKSGGADVLEALGIDIEMGPNNFAQCVATTGVGFLFAPRYHPAFKAVVPVRKILAEQGQRTIFNILGPLLNPTRPDYQLVGVFDPNLPPVFAKILQKLGRKRAWAVHGTTSDGRGVDEMSTMGPTRIHEATPEGLREETIDAESLGLAPARPEELQGTDAAGNAETLAGILNGDIVDGRRDLVLLNAAAGFAITGRSEDLASGLVLAAELIDSGAATEKLRALQTYAF